MRTFKQRIPVYAIVDIETTGGYAGHHRVTEIAVYHHDGSGITDHFNLLVNPERNVPAYITGLTGITNEMVKDAPTFAEVADEIMGWLKDRVFVAHNAHFDYGFLKKEFEDAGITWNARKLCTVKLSRKIIPGLDSYGLGRLSESLGIVIQNRHRAFGDAEATAKLFDLLLRRDTEGVIAKALKRNSGETILPPHLPREEYDALPSAAGVYYFHNAKGEVIYVGKALNIRKRMAGHFSGDAREWNRVNVRNEIHHISYELTGTELIALILEAQEIRRLWPRYNLAQKFRTEEWGVFDYEDRNGYRRFVINLVTRQSRPLISFATKGDAWNFLWEKVQTLSLCPKLSGLQKAKGPCYAHQSGTCSGACEGKETPAIYNQRVEEAVEGFHAGGETLALIGKGRRSGEKSIVLVENGLYAGHGFLNEEAVITDVESARSFVKPGKDSRFVQNIINSFMLNSRGIEVLALEPPSI